MSELVTVDPAIQHGKPIIRGTRVPVARVLGGLAGGMSVAEVADAYGVSEEGVRAALAFAERLVDQDSHYLLPSRS